MTLFHYFVNHFEILNFFVFGPGKIYRSFGINLKVERDSIMAHGFRSFYMIEMFIKITWNVSITIKVLEYSGNVQFLAIRVLE